MHINPDTIPRHEMQRIDRWLVANGVREHVALEPVIVKGRHVEYGAMCRRDRKPMARNDWLTRDKHGDLIPKVKRKRVRIRVPLAAVA